ncbi:type II/IV secretion system ATPase subunit [Candidatus Woesearchaeota archaeon]|nr:type II/IV secretion system ATPase subunit [Candidatus Woesearchaeota archaeon]
MKQAGGPDPESAKQLIDSYKLEIGGVIVNIKVFSTEQEPVPIYSISFLNISDATLRILNKLRDEFLSKVVIGTIQLDEESGANIRQKFEGEIRILIKKYFPGIDNDTTNLLVSHVMQQNVGLGNIEILLKDKNLEEIVINNAAEPVWVYHKRHGWLKTNITIPNEARIRHYATTIGRDIGKEITLLQPLMDANLKSGDRVNATLSPISSKGNTITIRKFSEKPWSITDLILGGTMDLETAAWIWLCVQHELSTIIAGGTGSGKTSALNAIANFFPPNQRIISIEDTRELTLPNTLHWVPLATRLANPEGKGEITMLDLVVNSLRMRPDRIIMGEIRRKAEAEVLFEAMHTGHSVYGTLHANSAEETITRLTNPPIEVPRTVLSSLSAILVQNRNRRTGLRRTLQFAEIEQDGSAKPIIQLDVAKDKLSQIAAPSRLLDTLGLYTGLTPEEISKDLQEKAKLLKWLVGQNISDVHQIGLIMSKYYSGKLRA